MPEGDSTAGTEAAKFPGFVFVLSSSPSFFFLFLSKYSNWNFNFFFLCYFSFWKMGKKKPIVPHRIWVVVKKKGHDGWLPVILYPSCICVWRWCHLARVICPSSCRTVLVKCTAQRSVSPQHWESWDLHFSRFRTMEVSAQFPSSHSTLGGFPCTPKTRQLHLRNGILRQSTA